MFSDQFKNPSNEYRIKPFWFLNGDLDDDELKRQLFEMKEKGIGGVFICARQGLKIPYLSKKWFGKIKTICDYADSIGLENWLYDEYPYPSGISGGEVVLKHPEAKQKTLVNISRIVDSNEVYIDLPFADVVYAAAFRIRDGIDFSDKIDLLDDIGNLQRQELYQRTGLTEYNSKRYFSYEPHKYLTVSLPDGKWQILVVLQKEIENFKYYGTYIDPCNREAMQTFIDTTHQKYKQYLGEGFSSVKGMFSDEVGLQGSIPWTKEVIGYMNEKYGYSVSDFVPALYLNDFPDAYRIRFEYYSAIHDLFRTNYHKQVSDWCDENGISLATEVPSMRMSTQLYSHIVGGDTAHEKIGKSFEYAVEKNLYSYRSNPKSVSSLTRQLDQYFAMIEAFHSIGWSMTIQDAKWMIDRLGGFGINFYNTHAAYYTMESIVKHDAPPSQFIQNAYWKHYKLLSDYAGRMSLFVSETDTLAKIAVLDPVSSLWMLLCNPFLSYAYKGLDEKEELKAKKIKNYWGDIRKEMIYSGVDFDNLDADILEMAEVKDGKIYIGRAEYSVLILPPMISLEGEAAKKIKKFTETGGTLISVGMLPYIDIGYEGTENLFKEMFGLDGAKIDFWNGAPEPRLVSNGCKHFIQTGGESFSPAEYDMLYSLIKPEIDDGINIEYDAKFAHTLLITRRYDKNGGKFIFISNQENNTVDIRITPDCRFEEYSLADGTVKASPSLFSLAPFESRVLKVSEETKAEEDAAFDGEIIIDTSNKMEFSIDGDNSLPFDNFDISTDKVNWYQVDVATIDNQISSCELINEKDVFAVKNQGFGLPKTISFAYPKTVYYRKTFICEFVPENINLLMDESTILSEYEIYLNGNKITRADFAKVFVNDIHNIKCPVAKYVKTGENEIFIKVTVNNNWDGVRDNIFITGDFSLAKNENGFYITKPSETNVIDHRFIDGYPFFCGTFSFKSSFNVANPKGKYRLTLSEQRIYDCVEILVNGKSLGTKAFTPYFWIAEGLAEGNNSIEIKLTNTLIGMLECGYFDYTSHKFVKL